MKAFDKEIQNWLLEGTEQFVGTLDQVRRQIDIIEQQRNILMFEYLPEDNVYFLKYASIEDTWFIYLHFCEVMDLNQKHFKTAKEFQETICAYNISTRQLITSSEDIGD
jgi:hypothetical protein